MKPLTHKKQKVDTVLSNKAVFFVYIDVAPTNGRLVAFTRRDYYFYVLPPQAVCFVSAVRLNRRAGARSCRKELLFLSPWLLLFSSTASSRRGSYFARSGKVCKTLFGFYAEVRSGGEFFRIIRVHNG